MSGNVLGSPYPELEARAPVYQPPQQNNLLQMYGQAQDIQGQRLQNQTAQQTLAARQAIGQAYSQSIDPTTGQLDSNKLMSLVAGNPAAAYLAGDVAAQAQQRQEEQYKLNQSGLSQTLNRMSPYNQAFAPLMRLGPNVTPGDVYSVVGSLHAAGLPTDEIAGDIAASMPVMDPAKMNDPAYKQAYGQQLQGWVTNQAGRSFSDGVQAQIFRPNVHLTDTGGGITGVDTNPTTNPNAVGMNLQKTLSPGEQVSQRTITAPDGSTYTLPAATVAVGQGQGNLVPGGGAGSTPSIFGTGRLPGRGAPYSGPQASSVPGMPTPPPGAPPGAIQTGIGPAQSAGATVAGTGSANDAHNLYQSVATSGSRIFQLNKALTALQNLGPTGTGPGTDTRQAVASYLNSVPYVRNIIGTDPNSIASYDEANKYLTAYASNQASAMGPGTDSKLATALTSNASTHISNLAATDVVKATMGLERMQQAQAQAFTQSGLPASNYDQWSANWNKSVDPRAYAFDLMNPQQRGTVLQSLSGPARTNFLNQVWSASQNGFIDGSKLGFSSAPAVAPAAAPAGVPPPAAPYDPATGLPPGITP